MKDNQVQVAPQFADEEDERLSEIRYDFLSHTVNKGSAGHSLMSQSEQKNGKVSSSSSVISITITALPF